MGQMKRYWEDMLDTEGIDIQQKHQQYMCSCAMANLSTPTWIYKLPSMRCTSASKAMSKSLDKATLTISSLSNYQLTE